MLENLTSKQKKIIIIIGMIILICVGYYVYSKSTKEDILEEDEMLITNENSVNNLEDLNNSNQDNLSVDKKEIIIHIAGEVKNPGIVRLKEGSRIEDAVKSAGGLTEKADTSKVNLAYVLEDGIKVNIPNVEDEEKEYIITGSGEDIIENEDNDLSEENKMININKATQTELETLPGIGPSLALRIIDYREANGKFNSIEDIKNVSGIGDTKYDGIKDLINVK